MLFTVNQSSPGAAPAQHAPAEAGLHARVLDHLGTAICSGELAAGSVLSIDDLVDRYEVSRSVIREVLRVLASMGLIETRRRVGIMIQPAEVWNVFDPQVIRWRLASDGRMAQMRSITELRTAVEPHAAWLAAERVERRRGERAGRARGQDVGRREGRRRGALPRPGHRVPPAGAGRLRQRDVRRSCK